MKEIIFDWESIGAKLASLSDDEQSKFFTGFASELDSFDTHYSKEMQMISINRKLKPTTIDILEKYLPAISYEIMLFIN